MSDMKLRECPFCGGEAYLSDYSTKPYAYCNTCGASMPDRHQTEAEAIEAWNRRANDEG